MSAKQVWEEPPFDVVFGRELIYFIWSHDRTTIKIGTADNVPRRMLQIYTMNALPITLLAVMKPYDRVFNQFGYTERGLHRKFSHIRLHGEWFKAHESLILWINDNAVIIDLDMADFIALDKERVRYLSAKQRRQDKINAKTRATRARNKEIRG